jgi:hypothetical protein
LTSHRYSLAVVDAAGDVDLYGPVTPDHSKAFAFLAWLMYDLAATAAFWAIRSTLHNSERRPLLGGYNAPPITVGAFLSRCATFAP